MFECDLQDWYLLKAPLSLDGSHTSANYANTNDDPAHPKMRAELGHDQVGREVKDDIADIEEGETG